MANYDVKKWYTGPVNMDPNAKPTEYRVVEMKTGYVINSYSDPKFAFKACKFLNRGGGFNGNTPTFVARHPKTGVLRTWP